MTSRPALVATVAGLRREVASWRRDGQRIAMVPTMGALHDGHISLVEIALRQADRCVVSIFVNPKQFAPTEDLDKYPRQLEQDLERLSDAGVQVVFTPSVGEMYPDGFATSVSMGGPALGLETDFRPSFFDGVVTVVAKLFMQCGPDIAVFGQKDYQQLCVVRQLCRDLDVPVTIVGAPTIRDEHGLALSSRNAYLDEGQRHAARQLNKVLHRTAEAIAGGEPADSATVRARSAILASGFARVDYVAAREALTLSPWRPATEGRLLAAAWLGTTRLIDNVEIPASRAAETFPSP